MLSGLRAEIREVLSWTKLDRFFEIAKNEEREAVACRVTVHFAKSIAWIAFHSRGKTISARRDSGVTTSRSIFPRR